MDGALTASLENEFLRISARAAGAELCSIYDKKHGKELLWQPNPAIWNSQSPLLFPVVGGLNRGIRHKGRSYPLEKHGFAQKSLFECVPSRDFLHFRLSSSAQTLDVYPFSFLLEAEYSLQGRICRISYTVWNTGAEPMYFSLGGHPGFALDGNIEDYFIEFPGQKSLHCAHRISGEVLVPDLRRWEGGSLPITPGLFLQDALIFEGLTISSVSLKHQIQKDIVTLSWGEGFHTLGVWAKPGASYVCIEPWAGIDDRFDFEGEISQKEGVFALDAGRFKTLSYQIEIH